MSLLRRCASLRFFAPLAWLAALAMASNAWAADEQPAAAPGVQAGKEAGANDQIGRWIKDLDSDLFATRQAAAQKLKEAGLPAVAPVAEAAGGASLEVTMQAIEILRQLSKSDQTATREGAKQALEKLAKGDNSAASQAREALAPPPPAVQPQPRFVPGIQGGFGGGRIQIGIGGGNIQMLPAGGVQMIRIQQRVANGASTTEVEENGKKIKIEKDANNGIEIRVTEKVNGQDKTDTYKAKDADELKKKSSEAYKLYEKYGQQGQARAVLGNIQIQGIAVPGIQIQGIPVQGIQIQAVPIQANPVPIQQAPAVPQAPAAPQQDVPAAAAPAPANQNAAADARQNAASELARARRLILAAADQLKQSAQPADAAESAKKAVGELEDALDKLDEARRNLKP
jgi:hypothetical protein